MSLNRSIQCFLTLLEYSQIKTLKNTKNYENEFDKWIEKIVYFGEDILSKSLKALEELDYNLCLEIQTVVTDYRNEQLIQYNEGDIFFGNTNWNWVEYWGGFILEKECTDEEQEFLNKLNILNTITL